MSFIVRDLVQMGTATTGNNDLLLFPTSTSKYRTLNASDANNKVHYFVTSGSRWEVGIGTIRVSSPDIYSNVQFTITRDEISDSQDNGRKINFPAGVKNVTITFPAELVPGTIPTSDDASTTSNLISWNGLERELRQGVIRGNPFDNGGVGGIISTYSLIYTTSQAYRGGVLAPNGDIHFVPGFANRGQKVSASGVVSTYSLVYTTAGVDGQGAYWGGVLAPNGDIHFIPHDANRGQKISASGVVSTYSLVYSLTSGYLGGVLAPNGDIHFVPFSAERGQKISAAGVVSTYSLVYTRSVAYASGVLAPNGDIHFVPSFAERGQKISAAGVVSTYSLVYTTANAAFFGGVLAQNGDIHFAPFSGNIGQKISTGINISPGRVLSPFFNKY